MSIVPLQSSAPITEENRTPSQRFRTWVLEVERLTPLVGTGSPEGVVAAGITRLYMDETGAAGSVLYIKQKTDIAGDRSKGWVLV